MATVGLQDRLIRLYIGPVKGDVPTWATSKRQYAEVDLETIKSRLEKHGFDVSKPVRDVKTTREVEAALKELTDDVHAYRNLFVFVSAYHYLKGENLIYCNDGKCCPLNNVIRKIFSIDARPEMVEKLKFFFVQACNPPKYSLEGTDGGTTGGEEKDKILPKAANICKYWCHVPGSVITLSECSVAVHNFCQIVGDITAESGRPLRDIFTDVTNAIGGQLESSKIKGADKLPMTDGTFTGPFNIFPPAVVDPNQ